MAQPLFLGLAILSTIDSRLGYLSRWLDDRWHEALEEIQEQAQAEHDEEVELQVRALRDEEGLGPGV